MGGSGHSLTTRATLTPMLIGDIFFDSPFLLAPLAGVSDSPFRRLAREHEVLLTVEEGAVGGFGSHVMQFLAWEGLLDCGLKIRPLVLPDRF